MTISLDKLAELAKAATPGPWHVEEDIDPPTYWVIGANREERKDGAVALGYNSNNDANDVPYIAACDPATILKLLAVVKAAKEWSLCVRPQGKSEHALSDAIAALATLRA